MDPALRQVLDLGPAGVVWVVGAGLLRLGPAVLVVPALGAFRPAGLALAALLALVLGPLLLPQVTAAASLPAGPLLALAAKELLLGLALGLAAGHLFWAARAAGSLAGAALFPTPEAAGDDAPVPRLFWLMSCVVFVGVGGHRAVVLVLAGSYATVPLGQMPLSAGGLSGVLDLAVALGTWLLASALALAAPVLVSVALAEAAIAVAGRLAHPVPGDGWEAPARALGALVALVAAAWLLFEPLTELVASGVELLDGVVRTAGGVS